MKKLFLITTIIFFVNNLQSQQIFNVVTSNVGINVGSQDYGHASAWCDIDNDGDLDIAFSYDSGSTFKLFQNTNNYFTDITSSAGLSNISGACIIWADINSDGYNDLITPNNSYLNNQNNTFSVNPNSNNFGSNTSISDFNKDGFVDIISDNQDVKIIFGSESGVFENAYNSGVTNIQSVASFDFNNDGFMDIFCGNNGNGSNALLLNNADETFTNIISTSGITANTGQVSGISVGDINNDGFADLYVAIHLGQTSQPANLLYLNNGDNTFSNITTSSQVIGQACSRTSVFFDFDNDGFLDILVDDHYRGNFLYHNNQNLTFTEVAETLNIRDINTTHNIGGDYFGTSVGDYNNDGAVDIFATGHWSIYRLFENSNCTNNFLSLNLIGVESGFNAIGTKIKLTADNLVVYRWISPHESMNDFYSYNQIIGLGQNTLIDEIEITWSSGLVQVLSDIPANQFLTITEGQNPSFIVEKNNLPNIDFKVYYFNKDLIIQSLNVDDNSEIQVMIYDLYGRNILNFNFLNHNNQSMCFDLSELSENIYLVKILYAKKQFLTKILIE